MDPTNSAMAGEPPVRQLFGRRAEEVGGVPRVQEEAQAPKGGAEGQVGDQLQHFADQIEVVQSTGLHAHRGQNDHRHPQGLERPLGLREGLRGVAPGRTHEAREVGTFGQEIQAQG